jgi:hypothetical protein
MNSSCQSRQRAPSLKYLLPNPSPCLITPGSLPHNAHSYRPDFTRRCNLSLLVYVTNLGLESWGSASLAARRTMRRGGRFAETMQLGGDKADGHEGAIVSGNDWHDKNVEHGVRSLGREDDAVSWRLCGSSFRS